MKIRHLTYKAVLRTGLCVCVCVYLSSPEDTFSLLRERKREISISCFQSRNIQTEPQPGYVP